MGGRDSDLATSGVQSEGCLQIPSVDSGSGGEMAPLKSYRFCHREGEKGQGRLRVILKLCVIQAARKL